MRIIPTLLWKGPGLVKGARFDSWRRVGPVLPAIEVYNARDVDEIVLLDVAASLDGTPPDIASLSRFARHCFVPLTFGGGITELDTLRELLRNGADKISINTAAFIHPELIRDASQTFGSQCITVSIDARRVDTGEHLCYSHSGTRPTGWEVSDWARHLEALGAGELLVTSIDQDGTMEGYDLELIRKVVDSVGIPVIASGGAGSYDDMLAAVRDAGASAVAAASVFHFRELTPAGARRHLAAHGIPVRATQTAAGTAASS